MTVYRQSQHEWVYDPDYKCNVFIVPGRGPVNYAAEGHNDSLVEHGPCRIGQSRIKIVTYLRNHPGAGIWTIVNGTNMTRNAVIGALQNHPDTFKVVGYERIYGRQSRLWSLV